MNIDIDRLAESYYAGKDPEFIDDEAPIREVHVMRGWIDVDTLEDYIGEYPEEFDHLMEDDWDMNNLTEKQIRKIRNEYIAME